MRKEERAKDAFQFVLLHTTIDPFSSYAESHTLFPYVVIRDTLIRLNIDLPKAERMAGECGGTARQRFDRLKPELTELGFIKCR